MESFFLGADARTHARQLDERYTDIRHPKHPVFVKKDEIMVFEALGASLWGDVSITCYHVTEGRVKQEANRIDMVIIFCVFVCVSMKDRIGSKGAPACVISCLCVDLCARE